MATTDSAPAAPIVRTLPAPGSYLCGLTWDGTLLWHSDQEAGTVFAIDPADGSVRRELACPRARADLACDGVSLLQVGGRPKRILQLDPGTGQLRGEKEVLPASGRLTGIEFGTDGLWMCLRGPTVVQLRNYETMLVEREFPVDGDSPSGLTCLPGMVCYGDFDDALVRAIDPESGKPLGALRAPGRPTGMTWDGEHLWYCDFPARALAALDVSALLPGRPRTGRA
ncbi:hypothetical protein CU254_17380 [Amycolatopsis sp. AA4]|uniref:hypothetical protein n=1 Tax=Actinomycetes TaxID=1760 RepID=UPI0001B5455C|nr:MULTISPECIES: hypothetical protein [Actinomycetes]ATY12038.1 hypothetical protein CU254_17380 [Amycolatopsis sp. AA4]EFL07744.1 CalU13 [Streptomyces sp. AA4]